MYTYHDYLAKQYSTDKDFPKTRDCKWTSPVHMPPSLTTPRYALTAPTTHEHTSSNQSTPDIVQKIRFDNGQFKKEERPPFRKWVSDNEEGKARCHTISADYIQDYFIICLNNSLRDINLLENIHIFLRLLNNPDGSPISEEDLYYASEIFIYFLVLKDAFERSDYDIAAKYATLLLSVAISAPRNLRDGYPGTNQSIQEALDFPTEYITVKDLQPNDLVTYDISQQPSRLGRMMRICYLSETFPQLKALHMLIEGDVEVSVYTTGNTVQSSNYSNMNHGNQLPAGNYPFGIPYGIGTFIFS